MSVEDDEERTIKAQIEMNCQLGKMDGEAYYSIPASKYKRVNSSYDKLQIITSIVCKIIKRIFTAKYKIITQAI